MTEKLDLVIVGAGPAGLACAIEARRRELSFFLLEKGCLVNSIYRFPENMTFFTTAELLEIGSLPFIVKEEKPKRLDALKYYRRVSDHYDLPVRDFEKVLSVKGEDDSFLTLTRDRMGREHEYRSRKMIVATGYFDNPNLLGVPGEEKEKVSHYYTDPHPYFKKKVAVIGGKNSAAIAALELYRNGAHVTLIHRGEDLRKEVKYWVLPDIRNRIRNQEIDALFSTTVTEIREEEISLQTPEGERTLENDFVFALTGYRPDSCFLRDMGISVEPETLVPAHDPLTLESNVEGIYLAGSIVSGRLTNRIFIENGRFHPEQIFPRLISTLQDQTTEKV